MSLLKLKYYLNQAREKGVARQAREMLYDFYYNRKLKHYHFHDSGALESDRDIHAGSDIMDQSKNKDSHRNASTPYNQIFGALNSIPLNRKDICFLDYGCGDGRVLVSAMCFGVRKVIGIDIDKRAVQKSLDNCKKASAEFRETEYEVTQVDAGNYVLPVEVNVVFLFNPFGEATLHHVVEDIYSSYRNHPRKMFVAYCYPMYGHLFEKHGGFKIHYRDQSGKGFAGFVVYELV